MNKNLKDMLSASINNDIDSFAASFEAEVNDRISSKIAQKHSEVAQNIMKDETPVEEAFSKQSRSNNYDFRSRSDVTKFVKAVMKAGVKKTNLKISGTNVVVKDLDDGDMGEIIYFIAKDMKAVTESKDTKIEKNLNNWQNDEDLISNLMNCVESEDYSNILDLAEELSNDIN